MVVNIDGDLVAYRCAASVATKVDKEALINLSADQILDLMYPPESEDIALLRTDKLMRDLLYNTEAEEYRCFLTGRNNYRKKLNPLYKANRKDTIHPKWLNSCKDYLTKEWNAITVTGAEADDGLGITQTPEDTTCASLDKDLLMIPGWHYRWLDNEKLYVVPDDGLKTFYKQMLIGDKSDNIIGVWGIGKKKANQIIDSLETEEEMIQTVYDLYEQDAERFYMNANCLWIMKELGVVWHHHAEHLILPEPLRRELEMKSDFMKSLMDDISMELGLTKKMMSGIPVNGEVMAESPPILEMT